MAWYPHGISSCTQIINNCVVKACYTIKEDNKGAELSHCLKSALNHGRDTIKSPLTM